MAERHGVEIDYCPKCRGIWLDRGELDKIIAHVEPGSSDKRANRDYEDEREDERGSGRRRGRLGTFFEGFGD